MANDEEMTGRDWIQLWMKCCRQTGGLVGVWDHPLRVPDRLRAVLRRDTRRAVLSRRQRRYRVAQRIGLARPTRSQGFWFPPLLPWT